MSPAAPPASASPEPEVETRAPAVPCVLAWLVPGAGHFLVGRRVSGVVFAAVVLATFFTGLFLGGTVYAFDAEQPLSWLATTANLGVGPLDALARQETFDSLRFRMPDSRRDPKLRELVLRRLRPKIARRGHTYGRTFLLTAGLMNMLLVLDVFDRCIGRKPAGRAPDASSPPGAT